MTQAEQVYQKYLLKVEKNSTNDNLSTDHGRFVLLFNESQNKFIEWELDRRGVDDVRYIQNLLITDKKIVKNSKHKSHQSFSLPEDYLDFSNVYAIASSDCCPKEDIYLFPIKEENKNEILQDEFNKPSFLWREAPYTITTNSINIYIDTDFSIDYIYLSYYRYPVQMELTSPDSPESGLKDVILDFDDKSLDRIISIMAGEFDINQENQRFQLQKQRAAQKL